MEQGLLEHFHDTHTWPTATRRARQGRLRPVWRGLWTYSDRAEHQNRWRRPELCWVVCYRTCAQCASTSRATKRRRKVWDTGQGPCVVGVRSATTHRQTQRALAGLLFYCWWSNVPAYPRRDNKAHSSEQDIRIPGDRCPHHISPRSEGRQDFSLYAVGTITRWRGERRHPGDRCMFTLPAIHPDRY